MKVFVAYTSCGGENSKPLHAFANKELAEIWLQGIRDGHSGDGNIVEMEVRRLEDESKNPAEEITFLLKEVEYWKGKHKDAIIA